MTRLRGQPRSREARGTNHARRLLRRTSEIDALFLDEHAPLPTRVRGFARARSWLFAQPRRVIDDAHALLRAAADACPDALLAPTYKKEIGACVLVRLAPFADRRLRSARTFAAPHTSARDTLIAFVRHLFERFDTPPWLMATVLQPPSSMAVNANRNAPPSRTWLHVAQGGSFRDAGLPVVVTHAIAHALRACTLAGPRLAVRHAQIEAAKIAPRLRMRLACAFAQHPFARADAEALLARFFAFVSHDPIGLDDVNVLVRFVAAKMRRDPAFSFAGRTVPSLLDLCDRDVPRYETPAHLLGPLPPSGIAGCTVDAPIGAWLVRELDTGLALQDEGARLRHCVATYATRVAARTCAIFQALPIDDDDTPPRTRGLTLEVSLPQRAIVQVKGFANRRPTADELHVVRLFAENAALGVSVA